MNNAATNAARALARRSVAARKKKWGVAGFRQKLAAWGKLGGRPRKSASAKKEQENGNE